MTSVGRRNYLVDWFRSAARRESGQVVTADADSAAIAMSAGDASIVLPSFSSDAYIPTLLATCHAQEIDLVVSLNDYEISLISKHAIASLANLGVATTVPPLKTVSITSDKLATASFLSSLGLASPLTDLATEFIKGSGKLKRLFGSTFVVKHRYGSGSSGVYTVPETLVDHALALSMSSAPADSGVVPDVPNPDLVVVQEAVFGAEYGLDIVCDLTGTFQAVLARKKLLMRSGETDRAMTVDPAPFENLGRTLTSQLLLVGLTDLDVILQPDGTPVVIDINTRFGGGYPFSHLAGANVPVCYLAWTAGLDVDPGWLTARPGVVVSKYVAMQANSAS